jgi:hypothetical protein
VGTIVARVLRGAWRPDEPAPLVRRDELARATAVLHASGAGALVWWTLRRTPLSGTPTVEGFRNAYRIHTLEADVHALRIAEVLDRLTTVGLSAVLIKGWAIARLYPEVGLRPYTDIDIVVGPGELATARAALARPPDTGVSVDLHEGPARLDGLRFDEARDRSDIVRLGSRSVRVPCPEHHLRLLALHALRHGVARPIWLVDLAVALEARPSSFEWSRCLGPDRRRAEWIASALALSGHILGARIQDTPAAARATTLPRWFVQAVLRNWAHGTTRSHLAPLSTVLSASLTHPAEAWTEMRRRWNRPIEATLEVGGAFNRLPRWPYEVAAAARRSPELLRALRMRSRRVHRTVRKTRATP